ncbi:MAG: sugar ABC transporter permease, partial [Eubacteriales bacterium]|nr:sugar ABC transporter permease [Eubacteriales bacterium]
MKLKKFLKETTVHGFLAVLGFIWVLPIFFVILTSFRAESGSYKSYIFPKEYTLDNYINLFTQSSSNINYPR